MYVNIVMYQKNSSCIMTTWNYDQWNYDFAVL